MLPILRMRASKQRFGPITYARGNYEIQNLSVAAEWADQSLSMTHCEWSDAQGNFAGKASWSRQTNAAYFSSAQQFGLKEFPRCLRPGRVA